MYTLHIFNRHQNKVTYYHLFNRHQNIVIQIYYRFLLKHDLLFTLICNMHIQTLEWDYVNNNIYSIYIKILLTILL